MSKSKDLCAVCGHEHGKGDCMGAPETLERREWELGRKDGYDDEEIYQVDLARARRSRYYFAGYRKGIESAKAVNYMGCYQADRDELDQWQL